MKINTNKLIKVSLILIVVGAALLAVGLFCRMSGLVQNCYKPSNKKKKEFGNKRYMSGD